MTAALAGGLGVLGAVIGSFINVVVYRQPRGESLVRPASHCPACSATLTAWQNVPLISYLVLRGRCARCRAPISPRYPLTELTTGVLFAATAVKFGVAWALPAYLVLTACLVVLFEIDLFHHVLPRRIVLLVGVTVALLLVLASGENGNWHRMVVALASSAGWFVVFFAINAFNGRLLGFGDVRLSALLGLALGWLGLGDVFVGFIAANAIGAATGIALIALGRANRASRIPYGPFLATGCEVAVLFGSTLLAPFHGR